MARSRILVALVALVVLLAGCGIPDSGAPIVYRAVPPGGGDRPDPPDARSNPQGPQKGGTPIQTVEGFLVAVGSSSERSYATARTYLSAPAAWKPAGSVRVFTLSSVTAVGRPDSGRVRISGQQIGLINADGSFTPSVQAIDRTVQLSRTGDVWLIDNPPGDILLRSDFFSQIYVPATLYFLDPTAQRLVPDIRYMDASGSSTDRWTAAVRLLLGGPSQSLGGAVRTAIPANTRLHGNVVQDNQHVVADVSSEALDSPSLWPAMVAQFIWTIKKVTGGEVRLMIDGREVSTIGASSGAKVDDIVDQFDPDALTANLSAYRVAGGVVQPALAGGRQVPAAFSVTTGVVAASMSADGGAVAKVGQAAGQQTLYLGPSAGPLTPVLTEPKILTPTWEFDHGGAITAINDRELVYAQLNRPVTPIRSPELAAMLGKRGRIVSLRLAPAGVRLAMVISDGSGGSHIVVGVVKHNAGESVSVGNLHVVSSQLIDAADVAWNNDNGLVTLAATSRGEVVQYQIAADGSNEQQSPSGLPTVPTRIAAVPKQSNQSTLAAVGGRLYQFYKPGWRPPAGHNGEGLVIPATSVFYPS
ncbi:LpqB family beta-propeller domain-containing protein [Fodinicola acaciae]|uniref:LpqB family beta-propeller domain-containing protein n=1 Tax=Fodinicola acaciae TaxID=2681555 RepID=UPI0013D82F21|nr:LpqB family beta-propeller domain-containing protein [Fodinicola acaciae]